jgi:uncharacterized membrane protein
VTGFTLSVWKFDTTDGAHRAVRTLDDMQGEGLRILDYATVSWEGEGKKPVGRQGSRSVSTARLGSAFWGLLFGLIFFVPMLAAAMRAARSPLAGSMAGVGIDDWFIEKLRSEVTPGTSALLLMSPGAVLDPVRGRIAAQTPSELISIDLSHKQDLALRRVFGGPSAPSYPSGSPPAQDLEPVGSSVPSQRSASSGPTRRREETP